MIAKITANNVKVPFLLDAVWFSQNKYICEIQIRSLSTEALNSGRIGTEMSSLKVAPTNHFNAKRKGLGKQQTRRLLLMYSFKLTSAF